MNKSAALLILTMPLLLGGCVASMAASAVGAAVGAATRDDDGGPVRDLRAGATEACRARAAQQGQVEIIDTEQVMRDRATVWGTVTANGVRRSFQCTYNGRITGFTVRAIPQRR